MDWLITITTWYLYLLLIGIIFAPLAKKLLSPFYDIGYPFAKTIGIIVVSYTVFLLGLLKILPFSRESLFFTLIVFALIFFKTFSFSSFRSWIKHNRSQFILIILGEILFFISLVCLVVIRAQEPSIHGLEKFMDFGFMQSILRSKYFPPLDMWYSAEPIKPLGYPINYYYFGHLTGALLIKLTNISPFIGYNLILATIYAQGVTLALSLTSNLIYIFQKYVLKKETISYIRLFIFGLIGSFIMNLGGNLHTIYLFTTGYPNEKPVPFWTVFSSFKAVATIMTNSHKDVLNALLENSKYWYPNATRFIPFTIHEFPSYSYVVADLHGHVFDIPFVLLTLAILFVMFFHFFKEKDVAKEKPKVKKPLAWYHTLKKKIHSFSPFFDPVINRIHTTPTALVYTIIIGFMASVHYMTNAFDGPIYLLLTLFLLLMMYQFSINFVVHVGVLALSFFVFSRPFSFFFSPFVSGVALNCSPDFLVNLNIPKDQVLQPHTTVDFPPAKIGPFLFERDHCQLSDWWMLAILWGFFWITALIFVAVLLWQNKKKHNNKTSTLLHSISAVDLFVFMLFMFGTLLILIPEFFYIKDIYPAHFRANTMFKLGYQAFMIMSIAVGYVIYRVKLIPDTFHFSLTKRVILFISLITVIICIYYLPLNNNLIYIFVLPLIAPWIRYQMNIKSIFIFYGRYLYFCLFMLIAIYPILAFPFYYPGLYDPATYRKSPELDGSKWLISAHPEDKEIIDYMNQNITSQPVILEAQGDSYTDYERISSYTGLPTVAGWWVHEWLWRGDADVLGKYRIPDVTNMYESDDVAFTHELLAKYNVSYVIIGTLEKTKYPNLKIEKFEQLGNKIFESKDGFGALYQIKK